MADNIEEDVEVKVFIDLTADEDQISAVGDDIKQMDKVKSVVFSSKDDELEHLVDSMGSAGKLFEQDNLLNHGYIVRAQNTTDANEIAGKTVKSYIVEYDDYGET